jgi:saccharopine dehydrogenase-like NADP-dependent oxidoreductase
VIVANLAGPFQHATLAPLQAAVATRSHYVDVSEDRVMGRRVRSLDREIGEAGIAAFNGLSVVPGMEALFAQWGTETRFARRPTLS